MGQQLEDKFPGQLEVTGEATPNTSGSNLRTSFQGSWRLQERRHPTHRAGWRLKLLVELCFTARKVVMAMLILQPSLRRFSAVWRQRSSSVSRWALSCTRCC